MSIEVEKLNILRTLPFCRKFYSRIRRIFLLYLLPYTIWEILKPQDLSNPLNQRPLPVEFLEIRHFQNLCLQIGQPEDLSDLLNRRAFPIGYLETFRP